MPDGHKSYKVGKDVYDIPSEKSASFLKSYPNAVEVQSYTVDKDTFDIPVQKVDSFIKSYPTAKPLGFDSKEVQATAGASVGQTGNKNPIQQALTDYVVQQPQDKNNVLGSDVGMKPKGQEQIEKEKQFQKEKVEKAAFNTVIHNIKKSKDLKNILDQDPKLLQPYVDREVEKHLDEFNKGNLALTNFQNGEQSGEPVFTRKATGWEAFGQTLSNSFKETKDAFATMGKSDKAVADYLDQQTKDLPEVPEAQPDNGFGAMAGSLLGGLPKPLGAFAAGEAVQPFGGGLAALAAVEAPTNNFSKTKEMYAANMNRLRKQYGDAIPEDKRMAAVRMAKDDAFIQSLPNTAMEMYLFKQGAVGISEAEKEASKGFVKALEKAGKENVKMTLTGTGAEALTQGINALQGNDTSESGQKIAEAAYNWWTMDAAFKAAHFAVGTVPATIVEAAKKKLATSPHEAIQQLSEQAIKEGKSTPEQEQAFHEDLQQYAPKANDTEKASDQIKLQEDVLQQEKKEPVTEEKIEPVAGVDEPTIKPSVESIKTKEDLGEVVQPKPEEIIPETKSSLPPEDKVENTTEKAGDKIEPTIQVDKGSVNGSNWREKYKEADAFKKSAILRAIVDISKSEKELSDVADMVVKGAPEESNIMWAIANNPHSSRETFEKAVSNRALRKSTTDENIESLRNKMFSSEQENISEKPNIQESGKPDKINDTVKELSSLHDDIINDLLEKFKNDYSIASLAGEVVKQNKKPFVRATTEETDAVKSAKTPQDVLKLISETTTDKQLKSVADVLLKNIHKAPFLEFKVDLPRDRSGYPVSDALGSYGGGKINVSERAFWQKHNLYFDKGLDAGYKTILHEFVHAFTLDAYRKPKTEIEIEFKKYVDKAYSELKSNSQFKDAYGFKSPEEFISEVLTNPEFRYSAPIYKSGIIDKIVEFVAKILGYSKDKNAASDFRFEKVKETVNYILNTIPNIRAGKGKEIFYDKNESLRRISEAYHRAKESGNNPELVKAIEDAINKQKESGKPDNPELKKIEDSRQQEIHEASKPKLELDLLGKGKGTLKEAKEETASKISEKVKDKAKAKELYTKHENIRRKLATLKAIAECV